jgi:hypothetical protein
VINEPLIRETSIPPIIAVIIPADGGKPEAIDIPRHSGNAIRKTRNPDSKSLRQFSFNPARPVLGNTGSEASLIKILVFGNSVSTCDKRLLCQPVMIL